MVATPPKPKKTLIKEYVIHPDGRAIDLFLPDIDEPIALSVMAEMEHIAEKEPKVKIDVQYHAGHGQIKIESDDIALLALRTTQVMTRRLQTLEPGGLSDPTYYATSHHTQSALHALKAHAESHASTHAVRAIETLIDTARQIEKM